LTNTTNILTRTCRSTISKNTKVRCGSNQL